jgi:hypothetical protein
VGKPKRGPTHEPTPRPGAAKPAAARKAPPSSAKVEVGLDARRKQAPKTAQSSDGSGVNKEYRPGRPTPRVQPQFRRTRRYDAEAEARLAKHASESEPEPETVPEVASEVEDAFGDMLGELVGDETPDLMNMPGFEVVTGEDRRRAGAAAPTRLR